MISKSTFLKTSTNLFLRGLSVVSKLLLVIYLGKYLSLSDLGTYHMFAISAALFVFFIGFEFHSFSSREYEKLAKEEVGYFFSNQLLFSLVSFLPGIGLILGFFSLGFLPWDLLPFFVGILFFDLLSFQTGILLASRKYSVWFNILFFIRGGIWVYLFVAWNYLVQSLGLYDLFWFWLVGVGGSAFIGAIVLIYLGLWAPVAFKVDWHWIRKGLKIAFPFYVLVIFLRLIDYLDRYFLELYHTKTEIGIYSFFSGISNVPIMLVSAAVYIQYMPIFLQAYREVDRAKKVKASKEYLGLIAGIFGAVIIGVFLFIDPLLEFVGKTELMDQKEVLWILLLGALFVSIGTYPRLVLYAKRRDGLLLWTGGGTLLLCILLNFLLVPNFGVMGAAYSALGTKFSLLFSRLIFIRAKAKPDPSPLS